jgi:hypothetical protein
LKKLAFLSEVVYNYSKFCYFCYFVEGTAPMNISLTPQLEALVKKKVESGLYSSASRLCARPFAF